MLPAERRLLTLLDVFFIHRHRTLRFRTFQDTRGVLLGGQIARVFFDRQMECGRVLHVFADCVGGREVAEWLLSVGYAMVMITTPGRWSYSTLNPSADTLLEGIASVTLNQPDGIDAVSRFDPGTRRFLQFRDQRGYIVELCVCGGTAMDGILQSPTSKVCMSPSLERF